MKQICLALLSGVCAFAPIANAQSNETRVNVGTLRCTLGPGSVTEVREPRDISCVFKPMAGVAGRFDGVLKKLGDPAPTADKLVLLWTVFADDQNIDAAALEGRYFGRIDRNENQPNRPLGALTGGVGSAIELHPLTRLPDDGSNATTIVLELDLKSIKV